MKYKYILFHILSITILVISIVLFFTYYDLNLSRFLDSIFDFKDSCVLWWNVTIAKTVDYNTVEFIPRYDFMALFDYIKFDLADFVIKFDFLAEAFWNIENFKAYSIWFLILFLKVVLYLTVAITVFTIIQTLLEMFMLSMSNTPGQDTRSLKIFKKIEKPFIYAYNCVYDFITSFKASRYYGIFLFVWFFNLNLSSIIVEFLAFVFGYPLALNSDSLILFIGMLVSDILIAVASAPAVVWIVIVYVVLSSVRLARAYRTLNHYYNYDIGFLKSCAYNVLLTGPTGASKTKTAVQMSIMTEDYFHTDQWESIYKFFQEYKEFPFYTFEQDLKCKIDEKVIDNMHTARNYVECLYCEYIKDPHPDKLYGYNGLMYYDDGVRHVPIWEMLEDYAQLYYMYGNDTSSIIANLSIRSDLKLIPGHFPTWDNNILHRTSEQYIDYSRYCHILNNNMFRYSKYVDDEAPGVNLEYGVNVFTELDKDQGNQYSNKVYDIKDDSANPLNDGYDLFLMLERHLGTVDFKSYIRNFADIQRDGTLREGVKGLYDELNISDKKEPELVLPFFFEGWFVSLIDSWLSDFSKEVKACGTVNTLPYYILSRVLFPLCNWVRNMKQKFTVEEIEFTIKNACSPEGVYKKHSFIIIYAIAHGGRYSTDCFASINDEAAKYFEGGIQDIDTYESIKPTLYELPKHKSYFSKKQLERLERIKKTKNKR